MDRFTIRDIENLCGVKAHTLRIWEQRYTNLFIAKRKKSRHRIYDSDDLKELLRISFLYHYGYKISKIAGLGPEKIKEEIAKIKTQECNYEVFVLQLIEASVSFDKENFEKIVNNLVLRIGSEKCIIQVFYPFLHRIGLLWMTNHVIPAQEHFASHIIRKKIICAIDGIEVSPNTDRNVIIFSPAGELHEIPLLVANYFFRKQGIRTTYFGLNVDIGSLQLYAAEHSITHFFSHLITKMDKNGLKKNIDSLCKLFPDKKILVSGPASESLANSHINLQFLQSPEEMINYISTLVQPI